MSVIEITALRLEGVVDNYLEAKGEAPPEPADMSMSALKGDSNVPDTFYIDNIQKTINLQFPWKQLDMTKPVVPRDGVMGPATKKALDDIKRVATELNNPTAIAALKKIEAGELRAGASELWDAAREIEQMLKTDEKYFAETTGDIYESGWDYQKKRQYLSTTTYPLYFPKPWQAKNMCSIVSGGGRHGEFIKQPTEAEFRSCQTPAFNHFLMWGPECPSCGIQGSDPRFLRIKSTYPEAFSFEKMKHRRVNHIWSPVIPSPGFTPYVAAPPEGTPYYSNPNDPRPETEGVRFFDQADEKWYREYLAKFEQFKEEFGGSAAEYNKMFFQMMPHKKTKSRYSAPNEWSANSYGRTESLWPDGTPRPPAAELSKIIQERGLGTSSSVRRLADELRKKGY
ncbi:MAG: hypothetical protein ACXADB_00115 [Candidatus Hermodarchaeia archaeon]|jgi:hypothetical protein